MKGKGITIDTSGGTTFHVLDSNVTITRHDQPEVTIPEDDLEEFAETYFTPSAPSAPVDPDSDEDLNWESDNV